MQDSKTVSAFFSCNYTVHNPFGSAHPKYQYPHTYLYGLTHPRLVPRPRHPASIRRLLALNHRATLHGSTLRRVPRSTLTPVILEWVPLSAEMIELSWIIENTSSSSVLQVQFRFGIGSEPNSGNTILRTLANIFRLEYKGVRSVDAPGTLHSSYSGWKVRTREARSIGALGTLDHRDKCLRLIEGSKGGKVCRSTGHTSSGNYVRQAQIEGGKRINEARIEGRKSELNAVEPTGADEPMDSS
ncbi:hypothetical protein DFH09DRAFT_1091614 [Mycena vulgaris]|nr:hypothetical protein DFH09DRAFT_1091614 [Mycena vulgaris]